MIVHLLACASPQHSQLCHKPPHISVRDGVFRTDVSLLAFGRLFYLDNREIVSNKVARWVRFLRAARNGSLLERPNTPPLWRPHKTYCTPIWDALQSSNADVELELRVMCGLHPPPPAMPGPLRSFKILFVAGDGLALMRLNHLLANKADLYIDMTPLIIPIQGAPRDPGQIQMAESNLVCMMDLEENPPSEWDWGLLTLSHRTHSEPSLWPCGPQRTSQDLIRVKFYGLGHLTNYLRPLTSN